MKPRERFDRLFPVQDQASWLGGNITEEQLGRRIEDTVPSELATKQFDLLTRHADYLEILRAVRLYIHQFVPWPVATLQEYWIATCCVRKPILVRISIADQEVFTINRSDDFTDVTWTLNERVPGEDFSWLPSMSLAHGWAESWGQSRRTMAGISLDEFLRIMQVPAVALAIRRCNLWLMRQRLTIFRHAHNPILASALFDGELRVQPSELIAVRQIEDEVRYESHEIEGETVLSPSLLRVRSRNLVEEKKAIFRAEHDGRLFCEICGFDFAAFYDGIGDGIEAHHTNPLSYGRRLSTSEDLILVCPNCHRMLHKRIPPFSPDELRRLTKHAQDCT